MTNYDTDISDGASSYHSYDNLDECACFPDIDNNPSIFANYYPMSVIPVFSVGKPIIKSLDAIEMVEYNFRGKKMKRAPKREFYYPGNEDKKYVWGQQTNNYPGGSDYSGLVMPKFMIKMANRIRIRFGEPVNHAILIRYADGVKNHAPAHHDKLDKAGKYGFFNFSFGEERRFRILDENGEVEWDWPLANGSMLHISGLANQKYKHDVPKDKTAKGVRYSLIFRTIV